MTAPRAIDHAVETLFRAIAANARGDRLTVMDARGELVALASESEDSEARLVVATVDRLVARHICPNASREEIEQAVGTDVRRHVSSSVFLARIPTWGSA